MLPLCQHGSEGVESRLVRVTLHTGDIVLRPAEQRRHDRRGRRRHRSDGARRQRDQTQPWTQASKIFPSSFTEEPNLCFSLFSNSTMPPPGSARSRRLLPDIHDVDRRATQIWFHFFPLELAEAINESADLAAAGADAPARGQLPPADQVDSSHWFLYGHRYWPQVKAAIVARAESNAAPSSLELAAVIRDIAKGIDADDSLLVGITRRRADDAAAGRARGVSRRIWRRSSRHRECWRRRPRRLSPPARRTTARAFVGHVSRHPRAIHGDVRRAPARRAIHGHQPAAPDDRVGERQARLFERAARALSRDRFRHSAGRHRAAPAGWAFSAATSTSRRSMRTRRSG